MFSVSPAEIVTIAIVALLVFGPRRLPEIARRAGKVLRDIRAAANELKTGLEAEYKDVIDPLADTTRGVKEALAGRDESRPRLGSTPLSEKLAKRAGAPDPAETTESTEIADKPVTLDREEQDPES